MSVGYPGPGFLGIQGFGVGPEVVPGVLGLIRRWEISKSLGHNISLRCFLEREADYLEGKVRLLSEAVQAQIDSVDSSVSAVARASGHYWPVQPSTVSHTSSEISAAEARIREIRMALQSLE